MQRNEPGTSVVVGIDGSPSAVHAARWAVGEAISRDVPLRLIHVVQSTSTDVSRDVEEGEAALRAARAAVTDAGPDAKVETDVLRGPVVATLVAESADAAMICLGSAGISLQSPKYMGAIGTAVADAARTRVAIVRTPAPGKGSPAGDVAVLIDDPRDVETVVGVGLAEAALRHTGLKILNLTSARLHEIFPEQVDQLVAEALADHPEISATVFMTPDDVADFLATSERPVQLVVVGNPGSPVTERLVGYYGRFVLRDTACSVLLVHRNG